MGAPWYLYYLYYQPGHAPSRAPYPNRTPSPRNLRTFCLDPPGSRPRMRRPSWSDAHGVAEHPRGQLGEQPCPVVLWQFLLVEKQKKLARISKSRPTELVKAHKRARSLSYPIPSHPIPLVSGGPLTCAPSSSPRSRFHSPGKRHTRSCRARRAPRPACSPRRRRPAGPGRSP